MCTIPRFFSQDNDAEQDAKDLVVSEQESYQPGVKPRVAKDARDEGSRKIHVCTPCKLALNYRLVSELDQEAEIRGREKLDAFMDGQMHSQREPDLL